MSSNVCHSTVSLSGNSSTFSERTVFPSGSLTPCIIWMCWSSSTLLVKGWLRAGQWLAKHRKTYILMLIIFCFNQLHNRSLWSLVVADLSTLATVVLESNRNSCTYESATHTVKHNNCLDPAWICNCIHWGLMNECVYSRARVDLPQPLVFETVVSTETVGGAEGLVTLSTWVLLQDLQCEHETV